MLHIYSQLNLSFCIAVGTFGWSYDASSATLTLPAATATTIAPAYAKGMRLRFRGLLRGDAILQVPLLYTASTWWLIARQNWRCESAAKFHCNTQLTLVHLVLNPRASSH